MRQFNIKLSETARNNPAFVVPRHQTSGSAGLDLSINLDYDLTIQPGQKAMVPTGIHVDIKDSSLVGIVLPRSSTGIKLDVALANTAAVIDSDYQGEILLSLRNLGDKPIAFAPQTRVAQLLLIPVVQAHFNVVDAFTEATERGEGRFGSTGK